MLSFPRNLNPSKQLSNVEIPYSSKERKYRKKQPPRPYIKQNKKALNLARESNSDDIAFSPTIRVSSSAGLK